MYNSFAAPQAKGKAANDIIFAANALAVADAAAIGAENVTNGTSVCQQWRRCTGTCPSMK